MLQNDIKNQVKIGFEQGSEIQDNVILRSMVKEAETSLARVISIVNARREDDTVNGWLTSDAGETDVRGRVGKGWPWQK